MKHMTDQEILEVVQAKLAGKVIQRTLVWGDGTFKDCEISTTWNFTDWVYRVKPEPREFWFTDNHLLERFSDIKKVRAEYPYVKIIHVREVMP